MSQSGALRRCAIVTLVLAGACSNDSASPPAPVSSSSPPAGAKAEVSLTGDDALVRAFTRPDVRCAFPDVDGTSIALLSVPEAFVFRIRVQPGKVTVLVSDPGGDERDFSGTGVTDFDAAGGAQIDSPLAEVPSLLGRPGTLGALTAIKGSVTCAGQLPGTSTVLLDGKPLEDARVECNNPGAEVSVVAIADVGDGRAFVDLGLRIDEVQIRETQGSG